MKKAFFMIAAIILAVSLVCFAQEAKPAQSSTGTEKQQTQTPPPPPPVKVTPHVSKRDPKKPMAVDDPAKTENPPAAAEETGPPPKMEVPEVEFNAGDVIKGDLVDHEFVVNNKGEGVLKIIRVQPTCGCTVTKYDHEIAPGQSGKITASVKTENFNGDIAKTINVQTNDKDLSVLTLTVKAHVKTLLSVKPSEKMSLGLIYLGTPVDKEFDIVSEDGQPFDVTSIKPGDDKIAYNLIPAPDKKSAKFKVTVPGDYPVGQINANFTLTTTHPKVQTLNINVGGTMREPLSVFPLTVGFTGLSKDFIEKNPESPELNKVVTVRLETDPSLELKEVKCNIPFIQSSFENTQPKQAYSVKLHIDPKKVKVGPFEGALVIFSNKKTLTVPVKGVIF